MEFFNVRTDIHRNSSFPVHQQSLLIIWILLAFLLSKPVLKICKNSATKPQPSKATLSLPWAGVPMSLLGIRGFGALLCRSLGKVLSWAVHGSWSCDTIQKSCNLVFGSDEQRAFCISLPLSWTSSALTDGGTGKVPPGAWQGTFQLWEPKGPPGAHLVPLLVAWACLRGGMDADEAQHTWSIIIIIYCYV